ncbi:MAG: ATP-binding protein, partial [Cryobacterium sp.]
MLAAFAAVLLAAWLLTLRRFRRFQARSNTLERRRVALELTVAENSGRLSIIRELQDVAVLSVSRLISRAEGVRYLAEADPGTAARASTNLVDDGRSALADMRRVLTIAREGLPDTADPPVQPSIHDLFDVMRRAGLGVTVSEAGDRFDLKPGAELMIYRILQLALENTVTHGGIETDPHL